MKYLKLFEKHSKLYEVPKLISVDKAIDIVDTALSILVSCGVGSVWIMYEYYDLDGKRRVATDELVGYEYEIFDKRGDVYKVDAKGVMFGFTLSEFDTLVEDLTALVKYIEKRTGYKVLVNKSGLDDIYCLEYLDIPEYVEYIKKRGFNIIHLFLNEKFKV